MIYSIFVCGSDKGSISVHMKTRLNPFTRFAVGEICGRWEIYFARGKW